jgi:hypothetical protein
MAATTRSRFSRASTWPLAMERQYGFGTTRLAVVATPAPRAETVRSCQLRGGAGKCLPQGSNCRAEEDR